MHLLLLPGMDGTGRLFEPLLPFLPPSLVAAVVAYPPDRPYDYAELLPHVATTLPDGQEFLILGESFSGPLALLLAAQQPPGLRGVILCASFARCPLPSFVQWFRGLIRPWWFRAAPNWLIRRALLGRFSTPQLARMVEGAIGGVQPAVLAARARAVLEVDVGAQLHACPVPILYLAATGDCLVSRRSLAHIQRVQPRVEPVTLAGPHLLLQVAAEEAARAIQAFAAACESPNRHMVSQKEKERQEEASTILFPGTDPKAANRAGQACRGIGPQRRQGPRGGDCHGCRGGRLVPTRLGR